MKAAVTVETNSERGSAPEGLSGYDVVKAASDYSNVTGLVSGFALTAVVLVFTIAATADLTHSQELSLGFATTLFALGFVGCLVCAYSFAALRGERASVATLTSSMLVGSAISVCLVAVLGGFAALAWAFLPGSKPVFLGVCTAIAVVSPPFVWFPQIDIVKQYGPPAYSGPPESVEAASRLVLVLLAIGLLSALAGIAVQVTGLLGTPSRWEYLVIAFGGLTYASGMVLAALWVSSLRKRARASVRLTVALGCAQSATIFLVIALLP